MSTRRLLDIFICLFTPRRIKSRKKPFLALNGQGTFLYAYFLLSSVTFCMLIIFSDHFDLICAKASFSLLLILLKLARDTVWRAPGGAKNRYLEIKQKVIYTYIYICFIVDLRHTAVAGEFQ